MIWLITILAFLLIVLVMNRLVMLLTSRDRKMHQRMQSTLGQPIVRNSDDGEASDERRISPRKYRLPWKDLADNNPYLDNLKERLTRAGVPLKVGEYLAITSVTGVFCAVLGMAFFHNLVMALLSGAGGLLIPGVWVGLIYRQRIASIEGQLLDAAVMMASSLRAGHSFMQALELVSREMPPPLSTEFSRVLRENRIGVSLEEALENLIARAESSELELMVSGILVQRQVGGNLAEILDIIADTLEKRVKMRGRIRVLTAQGRLSTWVIALLPIGLGIFIFGSHPEMLKLMLSEPSGVLMLIMGSILLVLGIFAVRKVVNIDV